MSVANDMIARSAVYMEHQKLKSPTAGKSKYVPGNQQILTDDEKQKNAEIDAKIKAKKAAKKARKA
jgi:hypothetical protein